jgi:superfamily II DNA helicase RecQ
MLINMSDIMADVIESCLQSFPQVSSLKWEQKIAVQCLLDGKDVIAILPTGFGKSLIYQLYILVKVRYGGCRSSSILVVSPLKSIIEEQINSLQEVSISATKLNMEEKSLKEIFKYQVICVGRELSVEHFPAAVEERRQTTNLFDSYRRVTHGRYLVSICN